MFYLRQHLITDIVSEVYGKKAKRAVHIGITTSIVFILFTVVAFIHRTAQILQMPAMQTIFSNTPRLMIVSMVVYAIVQEFDVWAYHKWWDLTNKLVGDKERFLWLRNNGSTLISQFLNTILYTFGAFWGIHDFKTLISIGYLSSYIIFIVTSLVDTPFVYYSKNIKEDKRIRKRGTRLIWCCPHLFYALYSWITRFKHVTFLFCSVIYYKTNQNSPGSKQLIF